MGHSIASPIKDPETYLKVWDFLSKHYQHPEELYYVSDPKSLSDNDHGKHIVVFDYKFGEEDEAWAWMVAKWIAEIAGKKMKFDGIAEPIQYLRYDGDTQLIPITSQAVKYEEDRLPEYLKPKLEELKRNWEKFND